ncbi:MAG TPA: hypothetical protein EYG03_09000 [Planctomycetes bacterium]|nr:hypothetical protein [Fuerstiella sp.]HIK92101.1 hypothetical protein [Planctomycetota bacterium]
MQQPNDFRLPEQLPHKANSIPLGRIAQPWLLATGAVALVGVVAIAVNEWGSQGTSEEQSKSTVASAEGISSDSAPIIAMEESSMAVVDDSLLDWDDGNTVELASIRIAVERLDEISLQIIQTQNPERDSATPLTAP